MKNIKKPVFFIITALVLVFSVLSIVGISSYDGDNRTVWVKGLNDIRWGIDIRGGVDVTFTPSPDYTGKITKKDIDAARSVVETRMIAKNITDYEVYTDYGSERIIVRFPWQADDMSFDPEQAVKELGEMAMLYFYEGNVQDETKIVLTGEDVSSAKAQYDPEQGYVVALTLKDSGKQSFSEVTGRLQGTGEVISIWMDDDEISSPQVSSQISDGKAVIEGNFTRESAEDLANKINGGALSVELVTDSFSVIDPTMGLSARNAMALAGAIAFVVMCIFMIWRYKILGIVATIGLAGQTFGALAVISGFFGVFPSFTLTIPGIAGIILSIGMGVDANVITAERIKEEIRSGKTLDGAVQSGYKRAFSAIFDGNMTMVIVAFILMGAFGTPDSFPAQALKPFFFMFGPSAAGSIYAFGYTLIIGVVLNFLFGVFGARLMTYSLVKFKAVRGLTLYGGYKNDAQREAAKAKPIFDAKAHIRKFLTVPIVVITVAAVVMAVAGLEIAIEFKGGTILNYNYNGEVDASVVKTAVETLNVGKVTVKSGTSADDDFDRTLTIEFTSNKGLTIDKQAQISSTLETEFADNSITPAGSQDVNPTMGRSFFLKCLVAVILSFIVLMIYIALRFRKVGGWSAGFMTITALFINVLIVFSVFVFCRFSIDSNFIAIILTILCYTINDTIVVFDRIRENRVLHGKRLGYAELVNMSISQSFTRSLNTSITTCISMISICAVATVSGIDSMFAFAFPILAGLVIGFITSLFIVGPLWASYQLNKNGAKKPAKTTK